MLEDWLPRKKETKFKELIKRRKVSIISISFATFIATLISTIVIIHTYSSPCKNNGNYIKDENGIKKCDCTGTGFTGDQCHLGKLYI